MQPKRLLWRLKQLGINLVPSELALGLTDPPLLPPRVVLTEGEVHFQISVCSTAFAFEASSLHDLANPSEFIFRAVEFTPFSKPKIISISQSPRGLQGGTKRDSGQQSPVILDESGITNERNNQQEVDIDEESDEEEEEDDDEDDDDGSDTTRDKRRKKRKKGRLGDEVVFRNPVMEAL
ncbi:MAG: hypothetical protein EZS28_052645 [Streblomastix strix]|uniref:Uncharacterized protein n=1 Tax=Streblomastix strix TaxID=222440 RepID=A0A5J4RYR2_9EUKA|nr:MAG: hypothetical protein EZS28_052645 [Streblomastix strix]